MDWKDFFNLSVTKITPAGDRPYFHSKLLVPEEFSLHEMHSREFAHLGMNDSELKNLTILQKKILIRHSCFKSMEFKRICDNFLDLLQQEKEAELHFSTTGGGVYLFLAFLKDHTHNWEHKKIWCYTSEVPLPIMKLNDPDMERLQLVYRPLKTSFLDSLPSLWHASNLMQLFEMDQEQSKVASR